MPSHPSHEEDDARKSVLGQVSGRFMRLPGHASCGGGCDPESGQAVRIAKVPLKVAVLGPDSLFPSDRL